MVVNIVSVNGLVPIWHQAIAWTMLIITNSTLKEQTSVKFESRKCIWNCSLQNVGYFVQASVT